MHHQLIHTLSPHSSPLPTISCYNFLNHSNYNNNTLLHCRFHGVLVSASMRNDGHKKWWVSAVERESNKFEVDPDKAREALSELDQQLETLSNKQVNPPKIRASSIYSNLKEQMKEQSPEISGSFLAFTAFGLFIFSILYNVLFITVIKPSIDLP